MQHAVCGVRVIPTHPHMLLLLLWPAETILFFSLAPLMMHDGEWLSAYLVMFTPLTRSHGHTPDTLSCTHHRHVDMITPLCSLGGWGVAQYSAAPMLPCVPCVISPPTQPQQSTLGCRPIVFRTYRRA